MSSEAESSTTSRPTNPFVATDASDDDHHAQGDDHDAPVAHHDFAPTNPAADALPTSPSYIPLSHPARTLVLCFDGTGDQFDADNSNVVQFFSMLKKDDRKQQMVYYQAGIGTYTSPQVATPLMAKLSKTLDAMVAWNLDAHVMDGYEFLMQNYEAGDKICIFGFSRGAYTAQALAGMVHKVGLLPAHNYQQVPFAYKMYTRTSATGWAQSTLFKKTFSIDVDVEFVGVWDTVCSVGLVGRRLPFTTSNTSVKTFRHAVSLDERRAKFRANLFNRPRAQERALGTHPGDMPKAGQIEERQTQKDLERQFGQQEATQLETDVKEVWFAGCHCDVGGGSVPNMTHHNLARIPLRWMVRQCFLADTGIRFHAARLRGIGLDPGALYPTVRERPEGLYLRPGTTVPDGGAGARLSEEEEDLADALCPIYDQLALRRGWWALEVVPLRHRVQLEDDSWVSERTMNLGRGRVVPNQRVQGVHVHRSVKMRMEADGLRGGRYTPRAKFEVEPTWVD
ncbi:hypothetical protein PHLGIDRAFT_75091 [Phlebiopsis gigantea 11061_1 CR5-6]|uniref:T6SS Phospholipase effector Tle1-like catalytic domain-containing protein n=1 Tax=Phlebiopsis gigantea (strain 11061_1 CR5-6) TaxID=745531 RepID=A0A0C3S4C8_PHLG1|nr:hypothetical protein PHLGIDRAFT_75091 [Phlebiopsis gigantea 11061_1 CR5-6]